MHLLVFLCFEVAHLNVIAKAASQHELLAAHEQGSQLSPKGCLNRCTLMPPPLIIAFWEKFFSNLLWIYRPNQNVFIYLSHSIRVNTPFNYSVSPLKDTLPIRKGHCFDEKVMPQRQCWHIFDRVSNYIKILLCIRYTYSFKKFI